MGRELLLRRLGLGQNLLGFWVWWRGGGGGGVGVACGAIEKLCYSPPLLVKVKVALARC